MIIKSSASLTNDYAAISDLAHERQEPIYITRDGEGDLVVMSIEAYERREKLFELRAILEEREREYRSGMPTYSIEEVWEELESIFTDDET